MIVALDETSATVRKLATTAAEAGRLDREAAVLRVARHPGVVQLQSVEPEALELSAVTGWCLSDIGALLPAEVAGIGCAVATILADLHDIGIVHGSVEASHVLIADDGCPVLCSLGGGRVAHWEAEGGPDPADDVVALIEMLGSLLSPWGVPAAGPAVAASDDVRRALRRRGRLVWRSLRAGSSHLGGRGRHCPRRLQWSRVPTARQLAARLAAVPGARLPDPAQGASPPLGDVEDPRPVARTPSRKRFARGGALGMRAAVAAVIAGMALVAVPAIVLAGGSAYRGRPASSTPCPTVDRGCVPIDHRFGEVVTDAGRFTLGDASGNPLVLGRWTCGPALPALLRLDRGEVWVWDRWPADGAAVTARLAGRVEGAETLKVAAGPSGCDHVSVISRGGGITTLPANMS